MEPKRRFAAMGAYAAMLETCKAKINRADPNRKWTHTPIMDFKYRRYHFNNVEQVQQEPSVQQTVHTQSPIPVNSTNSQDDDDDCLLIEPEQDSFDESESDSDKSDLRDSVEGVHSLNQMLRDVCTELHCINSNLSAQCNDPVHTPQVFAPQANSTPNVVQQHNNPIIG